MDAKMKQAAATTFNDEELIRQFVDDLTIDGNVAVGTIIVESEDKILERLWDEAAKFSDEELLRGTSLGFPYVIRADLLAWAEAWDDEFPSRLTPSEVLIHTDRDLRKLVEDEGLSVAEALARLFPNGKK